MGGCWAAGDVVDRVPALDGSQPLTLRHFGFSKSEVGALLLKHASRGLAFRPLEAGGAPESLSGRTEIFWVDGWDPLSACSRSIAITSAEPLAAFRASSAASKNHLTATRADCLKLLKATGYQFLSRMFSTACILRQKSSHFFCSSRQQQTRSADHRHDLCP